MRPGSLRTLILILLIAAMAVGLYPLLQGLGTAAARESERCLAQAIYFEARGEPLEGRLAVAQVVLNRVRDRRYPATICAVVFENDDRRNACQFSFACDGRADRPADPLAWRSARRLAHLAASGALRDLTGGATHYHAEWVAPDWARRLPRTAKIGRHQFYRNPPNGPR